MHTFNFVRWNMREDCFSDPISTLHPSQEVHVVSLTICHVTILPKLDAGNYMYMHM